MASLAKRDRNINRPWEVRWRQSGSQRRRAFHRKKDAEAWLTQARQIEDDERNGRDGAPTYVLNRTLEEQWTYWRETRSHLSHATREKDRWVYERWLKPHLGHRKIGTIGHRDLTSVLTKVTESGAGVDTRIAVYTRLNMILDDARGPGNHTGRQAVAGTSKREREINPLSDEEVDRLLQEIPEHHRLLVDTIATLGLRPHEALILRGRDIQKGKIHVRTKKGNKESMRILPLPERLLCLEERARVVGRDGKLFITGDWRSWRRNIWRPAVERADLEGVVPYDLRHTTASKLIAKGATPTDVAEWMGHSVTMTLKVYGHLFPGRKEELAGMLNR